MDHVLRLRSILHYPMPLSVGSNRFVALVEPRAPDRRPEHLHAPAGNKLPPIIPNACNWGKRTPGKYLRCCKCYAAFSATQTAGASSAVAASATASSDLAAASAATFALSSAGVTLECLSQQQLPASSASIRCNNLQMASPCSCSLLSFSSAKAGGIPILVRCLLHLLLLWLAMDGYVGTCLCIGASA